MLNIALYDITSECGYTMKEPSYIAVRQQVRDEPVDQFDDPENHQQQEEQRASGFDYGDNDGSDGVVLFGRISNNGNIRRSASPDPFD